MTPDEFMRRIVQGIDSPNQEPVKKNKPPVKSLRPVRDTNINNEDEVNLKIALETSKTLEEFLSRV